MIYAKEFICISIINIEFKKHISIYCILCCRYILQIIYNNDDNNNLLLGCVQSKSGWWYCIRLRARFTQEEFLSKNLTASEMAPAGLVLKARLSIATTTFLQGMMHWKGSTLSWNSSIRNSIGIVTAATPSYNLEVLALSPEYTRLYFEL